MTEFLWFIVGLLLGGCISFGILCCMYINRHCYQEQEIRRLKNELRQKEKTTFHE